MNRETRSLYQAALDDIATIATVVVLVIIAVVLVLSVVWHRSPVTP